jgi:hypothetical protein
VDTHEGLTTLPQDLAAQRTVLQRLIAAITPDPRWRWLELSCSVAQGRGDSWSDLDLGLGVAADAWPEALADLPPLLTGLAPTIDALYHRISAWGDRPHQRAFVQYASGVQLDLVAVPTRLPTPRQPESIMLYDPDSLRAEVWDAPVLQPDAAAIREWTFLGWAALADLVKYLHRRSLWEAFERLHEARTQVWRLWAAGAGLRYPVFGLTTVLDHPETGLPPDIEGTVAALDRTDLQRAALACAILLDDASRVAGQSWDADLPHEFARFVSARLRAALEE